jgi:Xaa-Pro aminopeptidase
MRERSETRAGDNRVTVQLERRRRLAAERWSLNEAVVVIGAGVPLAVPGRGDRTYPFRSHSEYYYLTDRERPGGVLAFDPARGWVDFVVPVSREERLWGGADAGAEDEGRPIGELGPWLEARQRRPIACLGAPVDGVTSDSDLEARLREVLNEIRRPKDDIELERMRQAEAATRAGFAAIVGLIRPEVSERELQIEIEASFFRNGADASAYDTIVGSGPNSAILHAPPSSRRARDGELVLIDAGGEYHGYASDVTRTYAASGRFTTEQAELHEILRCALVAAISRCTAGTEWVDVHLTAARIIAEGLVEFGLLRGDADSVVERGAQSVFFPHGIGHMVGLGIRDASGALPGRKRPEGEFPLLRMDLPLRPRYVVTVEPGIYFVPALIEDAEFRERYSDAVNWERAERMFDFGGLRIEHNVVVTEGQPDVLTDHIPMTAQTGSVPGGIS